MRILVVNWQDRLNPLAGGAEVHLHEVFGRLAAAGHEVALLTSAYAGSRARETVDGVDVRRVGGRTSFVFEARKYFRANLAERFDVHVEDFNKLPLRVHSWSYTPTVLLVHHLFGRTAFAAASLPVALTVWLSERGIGRMFREIPVQAVSDSTADELEQRGISGDRIVVIPNGVNAPPVGRTARRIGSPATLLYLGRLQRYKRVDLIVRAFARLSHASNVMLHIAGTGPAERELRQLTEQLGVGARVVFHGRVSEERKAELLGAADVHVTASMKEGWGLSVLEAGVQGVPTIAPWVPGLKDSVVHMHTGLLVPSGDVMAMSDAMQLMVVDEELRHRLGAGAKRFADSHTWDRTAAETEAHLMAVAAGRVQRVARTRLRQRHPLARACGSPCGHPHTRYRCSAYTCVVVGAEAEQRVTVRIGARDAACRYPVAVWSGLDGEALRLLRPPLGARVCNERDGTVWELAGWPEPAELWITKQLTRVGQVVRVDPSGAAY